MYWKWRWTPVATDLTVKDRSDQLGKLTHLTHETVIILFQCIIGSRRPRTRSVDVQNEVNAEAGVSARNAADPVASPTTASAPPFVTVLRR